MDKSLKHGLNFLPAVIVSVILFRHTLDTFVPVKTKAFHSIVAEHVHSFMSTEYPTSDGFA